MAIGGLSPRVPDSALPPPAALGYSQRRPEASEGGGMGRVLLLTLVLAGLCAGATAAPPTAVSPSGVDVFGSTVNQPFTQKTLFPNATSAATQAADPFLVPPSEPPPPPPAADPAAGVYTVPAAGLFPSTPPPPAPAPWSGGAEVGLNGANGNADLFNIRFGLNARRRVPGNVFVTDVLYTYTHQDGKTTVNQALWNARDEILFPGTPWSIFNALQLEYDQLRDYDFRVGLYGGGGYAILDTPLHALRVRAGAGAVRELSTGPLPARWVPEGVFGGDYRLRVTRRGSFLALLDYYPRIDDWSRFRVRARAGYEHVLDPDLGMVLRLGVQDRYDSDPGDAKRNDLTYFATLGLRF